MDIDQVNQMVAALHYEIYNQARNEGKEIVDAFRIAESFVQEVKRQSQDKAGCLIPLTQVQDSGLSYSH